MTLYGILLSCMGWCSYLLLGYVRYATEIGMYNYFGCSIAASLELLAHRQNVTSLGLFYGYYFGRYVHLNCLNCFHFLYVMGVSLIIVIGCMIFLSLFLDVIRISMPIVSSLAELDFGIL